MATNIWWVIETLCITQVVSSYDGTRGKDKEEKERRSGKEEERESKRWEKKEMRQGGQEGMWRNKMRRRRGKQKHESREDRGWNEGR